MPHLPALGRRGFILGLTAMAAAGNARLAMAATYSGQIKKDSRFVVILLRGAMDGLYAVPAYGDPAYADIRAKLAVAQPGQAGGALDLGGFYGLHPRFANLHSLYGNNEALVLHAVAGPYRSRSHFEAQELLESGSEDKRLSSGWLNRALEAWPVDKKAPTRPGLAVGLDLPLLMRGPTLVGMYAPPRPERPEADLYARLAELHHDDPLTGPPVSEGMRLRGYVDAEVPEEERRTGFVNLAGAAGTLLANEDGPRVAAMELGGWDTHQAQDKRMPQAFGNLDAGIAALQQHLGPAWKHTVVLVVTEFGRTVRPNGNVGTDHGTGTVSFLAGGAVAGGRVLADWPGLAPGKLFQNRDLQPTQDLRAVAKGLLTDHLGLAKPAVEAAFPGSEDVAPLKGLVRA